MKFWIIPISVVSVTILAFAFSIALNNGVFTTWRMLTPPPEAAIKILRAQNFPTTLYIQTANGHVYSCTDPATNTDCWVETTWPQPLQTDPYASDCAMNHFALPKPPGRVVDQAEVKTCLVEGMLQNDYAVLADGSVWGWGNASYANAALGFACYLGPAVGLAIGVLIAGGLFVAQKVKARTGKAK